MQAIPTETSRKLSNMSFLCAIFVVMIHCGEPKIQGSISWYLSQFIFNGIAGVAVPFFFLISGYFIGQHNIEEGEYQTELQKRFRSLVIPFFFWNTAFWAFGLVLTLGANILHGTSLTRNLNVTWDYNLTGFGLSTCLGPLWYVRTLVILVVISPLIVKLNKHRVWLMIPALCIAAYLLVRPDVTTAHPLKHICRFIFSPTGLLNFSIGLYLARNKMTFKPSPYHYVISFFIGMTLLIVRAQMPQIPGYTLALRELAIPFLMFALWGVIPSFQLPRIISGLSFLIFVVHMFVIAIISTALHALGIRGDDESWKYYLSFTCVSVLSSIVVASLLRKLFPKIMHVLSGGR